MFSEFERIWICTHYFLCTERKISLREKFCENFNVSEERKVRLYRKSFTRVYDSFLKHGSVKDNASKANNKRPSKITPEIVSQPYGFCDLGQCTK